MARCKTSTLNVGQTTSRRSRLYSLPLGTDRFSRTLAHARGSPKTAPFIRARGWLEIEQIAVESNHRRRGAGRALMAKAVTHARAEGIDQIEAGCYVLNSGSGCFGSASQLQRLTVRHGRTEVRHYGSVLHGSIV